MFYIHIITVGVMPSNDAEEKVEFFSVDELRKILACSEKEPLMWQAMIFFLADTGMRRGEACGLRWADIDLTSGRIHITNNAQYTEGKGVYDTKTKSKKKRDVYANHRVIEILAKWKSLQKEVVEGQNLPAPKHVLHTSTAKGLIHRHLLRISGDSARSTALRIATLISSDIQWQHL